MYFNDVGIPGSSDYYCDPDTADCEDDFEFYDEGDFQFSTKLDQNALDGDAHAGPVRRRRNQTSTDHGHHHGHGAHGHHGGHGQHGAHGNHGGHGHHGAHSHANDTHGGHHGAHGHGNDTHDGHHGHDHGESHHGHHGHHHGDGSDATRLGGSVSHTHGGGDFDAEAVKAKFGKNREKVKGDDEDIVLLREKRQIRLDYEGPPLPRYAGILDRRAPARFRVDGFVPISLVNFRIGALGSAGKSNHASSLP